MCVYVCVCDCGSSLRGVWFLVCGLCFAFCGMCFVVRDARFSSCVLCLVFVCHVCVLCFVFCCVYLYCALCFVF